MTDFKLFYTERPTDLYPQKINHIKRRPFQRLVHRENKTVLKIIAFNSHGGVISG
jgi:hypothetical protein